MSVSLLICEGAQHPQSGAMTINCPQPLPTFGLCSVYVLRSQRCICDTEGALGKNSVLAIRLF